jgi:predicted nucleic acid-binding protein
MRIVLDTSIVMAVLFNEPERDTILSITESCELFSASSLPQEVGNAVSLGFRRGRFELGVGLQVMRSFGKMKIRLVEIDYMKAIEISHALNHYAYDAYMLQVAESEGASLFTLDRKLKSAAQLRNIKILEI